MKIVFALVFCWFSLTTAAQVGNKFPMLVGQLLNGKAVDLPESVAGKYTLVGMSWSKKAQPDFESWISPVWNKFVLKTGMLDKMYDINLYFVPMFVGTKKSAMDNVMKQMKAKSDSDIFPYVLFYKGDLAPYEKSLGLSDKTKPYVFLLDSTGKIVYGTSGRFNDDKMLEIEKILLEN
jgi:hypothetical protein